MNLFTHFLGRRTLISTSLTCLFATLALAATSPLQSQTRIQNSIKLLPKVKTVQFVGAQGDGGPDCNGSSMCRGTMLRDNESLSSYPRTARSLVVEGHFTTQDGKLFFILTKAIAGVGKEANHTDISALPIDRDTELPREVARGLGFSSVQVFKNRYAASIQGMFEVQAKLSVGLNASITPAPRGERHASVSFEALRRMNVSVLVFDAQGKKVATLLENTTIEGSETPQTLAWNGKNDAGKNVASGEYRVEVRCVLPESGASFAESASLILAPVAIAH